REPRDLQCQLVRAAALGGVEGSLRVSFDDGVQSHGFGEESPRPLERGDSGRLSSAHIALRFKCLDARLQVRSGLSDTPGRDPAARADEPQLGKAPLFMST